MRTLGKDVYIQRGETWSLDFEVTNKDGDPYMMLKEWKNPYLTITVTAARYEQEGDFRKTWWLDLDRRIIENADGTTAFESMKRFTSTEVLPLGLFSIDEAIGEYGEAAGGRIVLDKTSDFDITNFLFVVDEHHDGNKTYKYVKDYTLAPDTTVQEEVWEDYSFRVVKQFNTKDWIEQTYLFDVKVLAGESIEEYVYAVLMNEGDDVEELPWSEQQLIDYINRISDIATREEVQAVYDTGVPLMPTYDTKALILQPMKLFISANIQGRY